MDILTYLAHELYWQTLANLNPVLRMFILRWFTILASLFIAGWTVRYFLHPNWPSQTLLFQVLAVFVAVVFGLWLPLEEAVRWRVNTRNTLLSLALVGWIVLPYFIPRLLIRGRGHIELAWRALYGLEAILVVVQLLAA